MNIGVVAYVCHPKSGARAPIELTYALAKNHKLTFYAFRHHGHAETIKRLQTRGVRVVLFTKSNIPLIGSLCDTLTLYRLLKKSDHDIVSLHTALPLILGARLSGIPTVASYTGTQFNVLNERFFKKNLIIAMGNILLNTVIYLRGLMADKIPHAIVAISRYTADEARRLYGRRCNFIYWGSAPSYFKAKTQPSQNSQTVHILTVSRITPYKQFEKIIKMVNHLQHELPHIRLTIAGSSPQKTYLEYLKQIKNKYTTIIVDADDKKLVKLYKQCDMYVTCDTYLFFGMPVAEAASFEKPAIAFDYAAARELISHGKTGFVATTDKEFEQYMRLLITDKKLREQLGKNAQQRARNLFVWDKTAIVYAKILETYAKHGHS